MHVLDCQTERKKWVEYWDDLSGVVFFVSLASYNEVLFEDNEVNALQESLTLFENTINNPMFRGIPVHLVLNKSDLFQQKIEKVPLNVAFEDYERRNDWMLCVEYISKKFREASKRDNSISIHVACATDRNNVSKIFDEITNSVELASK